MSGTFLLIFGALIVFLVATGRWSNILDAIRQ